MGQTGSTSTAEHCTTTCSSQHCTFYANGLAKGSPQHALNSPAASAALLVPGVCVEDGQQARTAFQTYPSNGSHSPYTVHEDRVPTSGQAHPKHIIQHMTAITSTHTRRGRATHSCLLFPAGVRGASRASPKSASLASDEATRRLLSITFSSCRYVCRNGIGAEGSTMLC